MHMHFIARCIYIALIYVYVLYKWMSMQFDGFKGDSHPKRKLESKIKYLTKNKVFKKDIANICVLHMYIV